MKFLFLSFVCFLTIASLQVTIENEAVAQTADVQLSIPDVDTEIGEVVTAVDQQVYLDGIQSPWQNNSWNATVTYASTERVYAGSNAIKVVQNAWGGLSLHSGTWGSAVNVNPANYTRLEFVVNGGTAGASIAVKMENDLGAFFPQVNYGTVQANQWVVVSLPVSQIDPNNHMIHRLSILETSGVTKTYYIDNIRFVGNTPAPVPVPNAPLLATPSNGATGLNLNPALTWNAVSGASSYRVQVSTSSTFATTVVNQAGVTLPALTITGLLNNTTYYWRVNASNTSGTSAWSVVANFTTVPLVSLPSIPVLSFPASGATGVSTNPLLQWNASTGSTSYRVQVSTNSSFSTILVDQSNLSAVSYALSGLAYNSSYYWRVNASNSSGTSQWSTARNFTTTTAPVATTDQHVYQDGIQSPWQNNSWNATVTYGSTERVYAGSNAIKVVQNAWGALSLHSGTWGSAANVDPAKYSNFEFAVYGGTTGISMAVQFENDQGAVFPQVNYGTVPANQWAIVSLPLSQLDPGNQMIHRVNIMEMSGTTRTYYVDNIRFVGKNQTPLPVPNQPVLASPLNGATGVSILPILSWNAVSGASSYRVQVSTSSTFATTIIDQAGVTLPTLATTSLLNNTTYYWRVNASNASGTSAWSVVANFTTVALVSPPSVPVLSTPINAATGLNTNLTLVWSPSSGAASYRVQISTSSTFSSTIVDQANITSVSYNVSNLSYSTTYYWRVNATNLLGTSGWSTVRSFTTSNAPPQGGNMFVTAYYPDWSIWTMKPWHVDYSAITHIIHFSADPDPTKAPYFSPVTKASDSLKLQYGTGNNDRSINFQDSLIHYAHKNGVKALLCIGGIYGTSDANMDQICSDINKIRVYVSAISNYCKRKGYDGVDIDWEGPNNQTDFINLLTVMRDTLNRWPTPGIITAAVYSYISNSYHVPTMASKLDQILIMDYDMGLSTYAGFNSPLKPGECKAAGGNWTAWTIEDHGPQNWINGGFPKSKIGMGMPFYAWEFSGVDGPCQLRNGGQWYRSYAEALNYKSQYPNSYRWDNSSKVPYLSFTDGSGVKHMVSYDDSVSIGHKVNYAKSLGIGGLMIYELMAGWVQSNPVGKRDPLLQAVKKAVNGTLSLPSSNVSDAEPELSPLPEELFSEQSVPQEFSLEQNFPNPFNPTTTIRYQLPVDAIVTVKIYDMLGREIVTLVDGTIEAGVHSVVWDSRDAENRAVASGMYIYRMLANPVDKSDMQSFSTVRKLMLMK